MTVSPKRIYYSFGKSHRWGPRAGGDGKTGLSFVDEQYFPPGTALKDFKD